MSQAQPLLRGRMALMTENRPFRRSSVAPRRRRRSRALALARPLVPVVLGAGVLAAAGTWLLTSPRFAVAQVEVLGTERIDSAQVAGALAPLVGRNLLRLPLSEVRSQVEGHPWVAGLAIRKEPPGGLRVEVRERRPAVLLERQEALWYAEADGHPIEALAPGEPSVEPLVVVRAGEIEEGADAAWLVPAALAVIGELQTARPAWAKSLQEVVALGEEDFILTMSALPFPLLVRAGEVDRRLGALEELLPKLLASHAGFEAVDLRFSRRIVLQPLDDVPGAEAGTESGER